MSLSQSVNSSLSYIPSLFRHAVLSQPDRATIFSHCCCHVFKKKGKVIELPFCSKESGKKKKGNCFDKDWADKLAASDKRSYSMEHKFKEVVPGN